MLYVILFYFTAIFHFILTLILLILYGIFPIVCIYLLFKVEFNINHYIAFMVSIYISQTQYNRFFGKAYKCFITRIQAMLQNEMEKRK